MQLQLVFFPFSCLIIARKLAARKNALAEGLRTKAVMLYTLVAKTVPRSIITNKP